MNKTEKNLLLYVETRCVDGDSCLDPRKLNNDDRAILEQWNESGFVKSGRLPFALVTETKSQWVRMSDEAREVVGVLRNDRTNHWREKLLIEIQKCDASGVSDKAIEGLK